LAESVDESEFTSIEQRILKSDVECLMVNDELEKQEIKEVESPPKVGSTEKTKVASQKSKKQSRQPEEKTEQVPLNLADFVGSKDLDGIPYLLMDYLELVDWTGRAVRDDKKGFIPPDEPKILDKLGFTAEIWLKSVNQFSDHLYSYIGSPEQLKAVCEQTDQKWIAGMRRARQLYC